MHLIMCVLILCLSQLSNELHIACFDSNAERVRELFAEGSATGNRYRANAIDVGTAPLALAVRRPVCDAEGDGKVAAIAQMLIEAGAHFDGADGEVPLVLACIAGGGASGKPKTVQVLIDAGADLRARCKSLQMTALHWAITCGFVDVVVVLLRAGASATSVTGKKPRETPLQLAEKQLRKEGPSTIGTRTAHDEAAKATVRQELLAIRRAVEQAAEQRTEAKAAKKSASLSERSTLGETERCVG